LVGSSANFTWGFSGDVDKVYWGLKQAGINDIANNGRLVSLDNNDKLLSVTIPAAYIGRVGGSRRGNLSSGHVIFTLSNIKKSDERFYGCLLTPSHPFDFSRFDSVGLAIVEGK